MCDVRSLLKEEEMPDNRQLQAQIEELKANNEELNIKIDRILTLLNPGAISDPGGNGNAVPNIGV